MSGTLSYDVAGYYIYLPATFIYKDLKSYSFEDTLKSKAINIETNLGRWHESGNYVFQYTYGMALQYLPFFATAHIWASNSDTYETNGFSLPYQSLIYFGSMLIAFLGLYYLRKILLYYFMDKVSALTLVSIVLGSNYLTYASINGAMSHNYLFTIYCILIYLLIRYYSEPDLKKAIIIGFLTGLAVLTRPTEIIFLIIILFWGINLFSKNDIRSRIRFLSERKAHLAIAALIALALGSVQFVYWKYVTGSWIFYSYGETSFSWFSPHIYKGLFSAQAGWLLYSPLMIFSLFGFYFLYQNNKKLASNMIIYTVLFMYLCFAWDDWWYGGSLGQRAMVQAYPVLAFPLAAFYQNLVEKKWVKKILYGSLIALFTYLNIWYTHMAHNGGMLFPPRVNTKYLFKIIGTWEKDRNNLKLLDTDEEYTGERKNINVLFQKSFEGPNQLSIDENNKVFQTPKIPLSNDDANWIRASVKCITYNKEWNWLNQTKLIVRFYNGTEEIKSRFIRLQRHLDHAVENEVYIDVECPEGAFDHVVINIDNVDGDKEIIIRNIVVEGYDEM